MTLGIRPEDIEDAEFVAGAGPDELLDVTVDLAEPLGAETIAHFDVGPERRSPPGCRPAPPSGPGGAVKLAVDVERLHLFDPVSGASLRAA